MATMTKTFPVFDCDSHVVEPPAVWDEYVPAKERAWVKTQFCFHTDAEHLMINGRIIPAARERSNAAEVGWARWDKKEVGRLIRKICEGGVTVFLVEHDMRMVMGISDRVLVLNHGQLIADGAPETVRRDREVIRAYLGTVDADA